MLIDYIENSLLVRVDEILVNRENMMVLRGRKDNKKVIVKIHNRKDLFHRELSCLIILNNKFSKSPKIVEHSNFGNRYILIEEELEGVSIEKDFESLNNNVRSALFSRAGEILGEMQLSLSIKDLSDESFWHRKNFCVLEEYSWKAYVSSLFSKWKNRINIPNYRGLEERLELLCKKLADLEEPKLITLIHCDYSFRNLLIDKELKGIAGIIDFEGVAIGDPVWDLSKMIWANNEEIVLDHPFITGWKRITSFDVDIEKLRLYIALEALAGLAWVDKQKNKTRDMLDIKTKSISTIDSYYDYYR